MVSGIAIGAVEMFLIATHSRTRPGRLGQARLAPKGSRGHDFRRRKRNLYEPAAYLEHRRTRLSAQEIGLEICLVILQLTAPVMATASRPPSSPSSSPRLPSPPPMAEDQTKPHSPRPGATHHTIPASRSLDSSGARRIRPGTKAADIAEGPPLVDLSEVWSASGDRKTWD